MNKNNTKSRFTNLSHAICMLVFLTAHSCLTPDDTPTAEAFLTRAMQVLPVEQSYDYHRTLKEGPVHFPLRDTTTQPNPDEMAIADAGWRVLIHAKSGPVLKYAAQDLRSFLGTSMQVEVEVNQKSLLSDWAGQRQVIIAGTPDQLPGIGSELMTDKDYEIRISPDRIIVCGRDERGVMFGLFNLESRFRLRE